MILQQSEAIKIDKEIFDKKSVSIKGRTGADELFAELEEAITESEYIVIEESMHDYKTEQVIMSFLERYKLFIESYYIDFSVLHGRSYIKLKHKKKALDSGSYLELEESYTEDYYLHDCGGHETFVQSNGKMIDERLQDVLYLVSPSKEDAILDIGCGRGELTYALSLSGADVTGVDYSQAAISIAKRTYGNLGGVLI